MPIFALSPEEVVLLSSLAIKPPNEISPMRRLYFLSTLEFRQEVFQKSFPAFLDRRMILLDRQGKPHLDRELEAVFWTLNQPHEVHAVSRKGSLAIQETYLCRNGTLWVTESMTRDGEMDLIAYPFRREQVQQWFQDEMLDGVSFQGDSLPETNLDLSLPEALVLVGMQCVYRQRVDTQQPPLRGEALWVSRKDMASLQEQQLRQGMDPGSDMMVPIAFQREFWANEKAFQTAAQTLVDKGVLWLTAKRYAFSETLRQLLDPFAIQDLVVVKTFGESLQPKLLYILTGGYMLVEESTTSPLHVRISAIPMSISPRQLFDRLIPPTPEVVQQPQAPGVGRTVVGPAPVAGVAVSNKCPSCGAPYQPGQRFCLQCGAPLGQPAAQPAPEVQSCPNCHAAVPAGSRFCPFCGAHLEPAAPQTSVCVSCGKPIDPGTRFCPWCGAQQR